MYRLGSVALQTRRSYSLRFHKHEIIRQKVFWAVVSLAVFPACAWSVGFMNRAKAKRLKKEAEFGKPFFRPFPRDLKPFPWGDGQTPFFISMRRYWGFDEDKSE
ncbi:hypothetical protein TcWFU_009716 [Taenia crassiceps]|uniref:Uncharacterized protein n=1 Tax=Taenia crassiceps TaxID=6207 RepID=A0ABR4QN21_9CEST